MSERAPTSFERGLAILFALGDGRALGVTKLAEVVGREKSQVSRALKVLAAHGLVERDPETLAYRLGWRVFALAAAAGEPALVATAHRRLGDLVRTLGESAYLSALQDGGVVTLVSESPARGVQAVNWVGRVVPAGCTSAGYALLLDHGRDELGGLLSAASVRKSRPRAPQSEAELWERLCIARERGFAVADEEFEDGVVGVAAPVRDFAGRIVAAVNVSAPKFRFEDRLDEAGERVHAAAADLSRAVGFDPEAASILAPWSSRSSSPSAVGT
jgi:IclR family transcriptional regulator, KDG regulon repressor